MPALLSDVPLTDEQREKYDSHKIWVVFTALAVILLYAYLFTHVYAYFDLPGPKELAKLLGLSPRHVFDRDGNVDSNIRISFGKIFRRSDDERLVYFAVLVCAFLSAYYLPVRFKQAALAIWTVIGFALLFGPGPTAVLLCTHLVVYLTLHPKPEQALLYGSLPGLLILAVNEFGVSGRATLWLALPVVTALAYRYLWLRLLESRRFPPMLRTLVVQSAIVTLFIGAINEGLTGEEWKLPLGVVLFFFQWQRLIMYHVDYEDGLVPADLPFPRYLAVFLTPATIPAINLRVAIGQGYAYLNSKFLCVDKNRIVLDGIKLLLLALVYLVFGDWIRYAMIDGVEALGIKVYGAQMKNMVRAFMKGLEVETISVLATSMLELLRWFLFFAGVAHFKVGIWRLCGYAVDPSYDKPWLATNLATLWTRYTYHYREFLVRAFYYPVFFRVFTGWASLRIFVATLAATGIGNLIWGHVMYRLNVRGMEWEHFQHHLERWPYFLLLGGGIAVSHVYLRWRKRLRKPWTWDRWVWTDVVAAYCTLQWFALIHIFTRPTRGSTAWDLFRLFAKGFGIDLPA